MHLSAIAFLASLSTVYVLFFTSFTLISLIAYALLIVHVVFFASEMTSHFLVRQSLRARLPSNFGIPRDRVQILIGDVIDRMNFFIDCQLVLLASRHLAANARFIGILATVVLLGNLADFASVAMATVLCAFTLPPIYERFRAPIDRALLAAATFVLDSLRALRGRHEPQPTKQKKTD